MGYEVRNEQLENISLDTYVLINNGGVLQSCVVVKSLLDCADTRNMLSTLLANEQISSFYHGKLIENLHNGTPKSTYIEIDNTLVQDFDINEFVGFIEGAFGIPFSTDNTVLQAVDILGHFGYLFRRIIKNNLP